MKVTTGMLSSNTRAGMSTTSCKGGEDTKS